MIRLKNNKIVFLGWLLSGLAFFISCTDTDYNRVQESAEVAFMATVSELGETTKNDAGLEQSGSSVPTCELISPQTDSLWLITSVSEGFALDAATKAAPVTDMYNEFMMYGYTFDDNWTESAIPNLMYAETLTKSGTTWKPSTNFFWQAKGKNVRFFAYAPVTQSGLNVINPATAASAGSPEFTLAVPLSVADQQDLLVSRTADLPDNTNTCQPLTFNHALTAVKFKAAANMPKSTVKKITLKRVYGAAKFSYDKMSWSDFATTTDFSQIVSIPVTGAGDITRPAQTFMMIPQTLPANASIEVVIKEDISGFERTLTVPIAGKVWRMGYTTTYTVSSSALELTPTLTVTAPSAYTYAGGTQNYTVTSYATNKLGEKFPIKWKTEFSTDGGSTWNTNKPTWLEPFTISGNGNVTAGETYTAKVLPQTGVSKTGKDLLDQTVKGTAANPYDLSTNGGTASMNTANCYVVNGPGIYKIPLVFGNAIKGGSANTAACNGSNFVAGSGNLITAPWIKNNAGSNPVNATLVWQEVNNLITDIKIDGDYLVFTVAQSTIQPGNAIVAVRSADNYIRWSWHIWVTPWKPGEETEVKTGVKLMNVNLGWVDNGSLTFYAPRSVKVRFTQDGYPSTAKTIDINQSSCSIPNQSGYAPYYQWGRKDPQCATDGASNNRRTVYGSFQPINESSVSTTPKVQGIIKPHVFFKVGSAINWCSDLNTADWGLNNVKTVYDPAPFGYRVPHNTVFDGLTRSGTWNNGQSFGSNGSFTFFRALGVINPQNAGYALFGEGKYWTNVRPGTQDNHARSLDFTSSAYNTSFSRPSGAGCNVRAVKD